MLLTSPVFHKKSYPYVKKIFLNTNIYPGTLKCSNVTKISITGDLNISSMHSKSHPQFFLYFKLIYH